MLKIWGLGVSARKLEFFRGTSRLRAKDALPRLMLPLPLRLFPTQNYIPEVGQRFFFDFSTRTPIALIFKSSDHFSGLGVWIFKPAILRCESENSWQITLLPIPSTGSGGYQTKKKIIYLMKFGGRDEMERNGPILPEINFGTCPSPLQQRLKDGV